MLKKPLRVKPTPGLEGSITIIDTSKSGLLFDPAVKVEDGLGNSTG